MITVQIKTYICCQIVRCSFQHDSPREKLHDHPILTSTLLLSALLRKDHTTPPHWHRKDTVHCSTVGMNGIPRDIRLHKKQITAKNFNGCLRGKSWNIEKVVLRAVTKRLCSTPWEGGTYCFFSSAVNSIHAVLPFTTGSPKYTKWDEKKCWKYGRENLLNPNQIISRNYIFALFHPLPTFSLPG